MTDSELLAEYIETRADAAFAQLMLRHVDLVYSSALRQTRDPELADEITQAVFVVLSQKARSIGPREALAPWLYNATRLAVLDARRQTARRRHHEQRASSMAGGKITAENRSGDAWVEVASMLDDALAALSPKERATLVLRYFENRSIEEVSGKLGISREAVAKRMTRALGKLREYFARRGKKFALPALALLISGHAVHAAPASVSAALTANIAAAKSGSAGASIVRANGVLRMMSTIQYRKWIRAAAACILLFFIGTLALQRGGSASIPASLRQTNEAMTAAPQQQNPANVTRTEMDEAAAVGIPRAGTNANADAAQKLEMTADQAAVAKTKPPVLNDADVKVADALRARAVELEKTEKARKAGGRSTGSNDAAAAPQFVPPPVFINNGNGDQQMVFERDPAQPGDQQAIFRAVNRVAAPVDPNDLVKKAPEKKDGNKEF